MPKAIAVQAVFLIAVISIFLFFIVAVFWGWIGTTKDVTGEAGCKAHKISYCSGLVVGKTPDWNSACGAEPSLSDCCKSGFESLKCPK